MHGDAAGPHLNCVVFVFRGVVLIHATCFAMRDRVDRARARAQRSDTCDENGGERMVSCGDDRNIIIWSRCAVPVALGNPHLE